MNRIRKGDQVIVIAGSEKGRRGVVLGVLADDRVVIENVNKVKKHQKPRQGGQGPVPGGIVEKEAPLHVSKVALWNPATKKGGRVGIKQLADGKRVRFFKSNGEMIDA